MGELKESQTSQRDVRDWKGWIGFHEEGGGNLAMGPINEPKSGTATEWGRFHSKKISHKLQKKDSGQHMPKDHSRVVKKERQENAQFAKYMLYPSYVLRKEL